MSPSPTAQVSVGELVELATYRLTSGRRRLCGQRVRGIVRITDKPIGTSGRSFLVERGLTSHAELLALVRDYTEQSELRDEPAVLARLDLAERIARAA